MIFVITTPVLLQVVAEAAERAWWLSVPAPRQSPLEPEGSSAAQLAAPEVLGDALQAAAALCGPSLPEASHRLAVAWHVQCVRIVGGASVDAGACSAAITALSAQSGWSGAAAGESLEDAGTLRGTEEVLAGAARCAWLHEVCLWMQAAISQPKHVNQ